jgi:hypothetical protein
MNSVYIIYSCTKVCRVKYKRLFDASNWNDAFNRQTPPCGRNDPQGESSSSAVALPSFRPRAEHTQSGHSIASRREALQCNEPCIKKTVKPYSPVVASRNFQLLSGWQASLVYG